MTFHPARDMRRMVQQPEHQGDFAIRTDLTRHPHEIMTNCPNLTTGHADFCIINFMTRPVTRHDLDREDTIMVMRGKPSVCFGI
jgi:hypothetical protein